MAAARAGEMRAMRMQQQQPRRQVRTREFSDRQKDAVSQPSNGRRHRSSPTSRIDLLTWLVLYRSTRKGHVEQYITIICSMKFSLAAIFVSVSSGGLGVTAFAPVPAHVGSLSHATASSTSGSISPTSLLYASTATPETRQFTKELKNILSPRNRQAGRQGKNSNKRGGAANISQPEQAEQYLLSNLDRADVVSVTKVVGAWSRSRDRNAPARAEELVAKITQIADDDNRLDLRPNAYTYNALINCFARRGMTDKAEEYLEAVQSLPGVQADAVTYNSVINAHATSRRGKRDGADRALELLEEMKASSDRSVQPDAITYGSVIKCLTNAGGKANAERAEELLNELERLYDESGRDDRLASNTIIYNSVLDAFASIRGGGGIARAEAILDRMEDLRAAGGSDVSPDAFTFSSLIKAWASASTGSDRKNMKNDNESDKSDSDLLGRSAAERAQQLLDRMEQLHRDGDDNVKPTTVVYNSVITAWAKSGEAGSAERAEDLLARMQQMAKTSGDADVRADTISFNSVIDAWARAEEYGSAERAENLLNSMERQYIAGDEAVKPDIKSFNSCINAWSRTGGPGAGLRAEQLLDRIEALYEDTEDDDIKPNQITYASVIHAHAKSFKKGCGEFAEAILDHMEELYEDDGVVEARPNPIAFSAVLQAWKNSEVGLSPPRAEGLLMRMLEFVDRNNGWEVQNANKTFDLAVRILDASYDADAIARIEALRNKLEVE